MIQSPLDSKYIQYIVLYIDTYIHIVKVYMCMHVVDIDSMYVCVLYMDICTHIYICREVHFEQLRHSLPDK